MSTNSEPLVIATPGTGGGLSTIKLFSPVIAVSAAAVTTTVNEDSCTASSEITTLLPSTEMPVYVSLRDTV